MATNIYVLRLQGGRYYVGKTGDIMKRFQQHLKGYGSAWTKKYKPVSLEKTHMNVSPFQEDSITKEYMSKHGIDKVRGGSYCEITLSGFQMEVLKIEIRGAKDLCSNCGRAGHWVKDCYATKHASGNKIQYEKSSEEEWECEYCDRTFTTKYGCNVHQRSCKKKATNSTTCGSTNSDSYPDVEEWECDEWECEYCDRTFTTKYGCSVHQRSCKKKATNSTKCGSTKSGSCYPWWKFRTLLA